MSKKHPNQTKEQAEIAASLIVDALMMAGIIENKDSDKAAEIVEEEILVRKGIGKL